MKVLLRIVVDDGQAIFFFVVEEAEGERKKEGPTEEGDLGRFSGRNEIQREG